jgi:hypothetical protein
MGCQFGVLFDVSVHISPSVLVIQTSFAVSFKQF